MPDPMWRQIADELRAKIESGELGHDGRALPTELDLADQYQVSRNTVRDALGWLRTRGLIEGRPGKGTFVVKKIDPFVTRLSPELGAVLGGENTAYQQEVEAQRRQASVSPPLVGSQQAAGTVAAELRVTDGTPVVSRHQDRFIDGQPWSRQTSFYPLRLVEQGATQLLRAEDIAIGAIAYIEEARDIKRAGRRDKFTVREPDRHELEFFALPDTGRVAIFEIIQTVYDQTGIPFALTVTTYPADRNRFVVTAGQVFDL